MFHVEAELQERSPLFTWKHMVFNETSSLRLFYRAHANLWWGVCDLKSQYVYWFYHHETFSCCWDKFDLIFMALLSLDAQQMHLTSLYWFILDIIQIFKGSWINTFQTVCPYFQGKSPYLFSNFLSLAGQVFKLLFFKYVFKSKHSLLLFIYLLIY